MKKIDVIVPVYRGLEETKDCIESTLATMSFTNSQLIIINDRSPEPDITKYLQTCAENHPAFITLIENQKNIGFIESVNLGFALNPDHDVLILNNDAKVANDWLNRMRAAAESDLKIGSVTPFSNNATICSFPNIFQDNDLFENLTVAELDSACAQANPECSVIDIPTGVGFCMLIRRECLNEVGFFDSLFGKGYGEENEWCQRASKAGWRNIQALNVFVEHKGGLSFAERRGAEQDKALATMSKLYPDYLADTKNFISNDPAKPYRIKFLLTAIAGIQKPKILAIDHGMGGGVAQHVKELACTFQQVVFLRLRPVNEHQVRLELSAKYELKDSLTFDVATQYADIVEICKFLAIGHIHFHHIIGLPESLLSLHLDLHCHYDVTIHDYYFINGNPTLTDISGRFCGDALHRDQLCAECCPIRIPVEDWKTKSTQFLSEADRVIFPSADVRKRFMREFSLGNQITAWHPDAIKLASAPEPVFNYPWQQGEPLKVLILGYLNRAKGADIVDRVAAGLNSSHVELHLLGYPFQPLSKKLKVHGPFQLSEAEDKIDRIGPHVVWFPAQWPETYSYTLSIVIAKGLPVVVPDIGAFAERVSRRQHSAIMPWDLDVADWLAFWNTVAKTGTLPQAQTGLVKPDHSAEFYTHDFIQNKYDRTSTGLLTLKKINNWLPKEAEQRLSLKEKVVRVLWYLREHPVLGKFALLIPFKLQRNIKRKLSRKALHDIVR